MPEWLFREYWPWWLCAAFFGVFVIGMWLLERRLVGVSGSYAAAVERTRAEDDAARSLDEADPEEIEDALMRATLAAFGEEDVAAFEQETHEPVLEVAAPRKLLPRTVHITFLVMVAVGGALGALLQGSWHVHLDLGPVHEALTGGGASSVGALLLGGVLVGFGTRMSGGCTSGHGLSGCSRLVPASLAATAAFFGTGVAASFLMEVLAR